ncbi:hypothetical protein RIF29_34153 [Crotalaria pallida]|uniref:Uncharacterized protein n=1 Tax=Crotalaria pallida TaxID=3830 RepID=A0AAN9E8N2_CROPI
MDMHLPQSNELQLSFNDLVLQATVFSKGDGKVRVVQRFSSSSKLWSSLKVMVKRNGIPGVFPLEDPSLSGNPLLSTHVLD